MIEILSLCYEYLENYMDTEGLFRVSAENTAITVLYDQLNTPDAYIIPPHTSPHTVAAVVKKVLRSADTSLIPFDKLEELYAAAETKNTNAFKSSLETMLPYQFSVLEKLIEFLSKVIERSFNNKMDARNIAIVFSPSFCSLADENPQLYLLSQKKISCIIEFLLAQYKILFIG